MSAFTQKENEECNKQRIQGVQNEIIQMKDEGLNSADGVIELIADKGEWIVEFRIYKTREVFHHVIPRKTVHDRIEVDDVVIIPSDKVI